MFALLTLPRGRVSPRRAAAAAPQEAEAYGIVIRLPARRAEPVPPAPAPLLALAAAG